MDPQCFDADPEPDPDPAQNLDADPDPDLGGEGGRSAKNVHPPWQNPRYAPACVYFTKQEHEKGFMVNEPITPCSHPGTSVFDSP